MGAGRKVMGAGKRASGTRIGRRIDLPAFAMDAATAAAVRALSVAGHAQPWIAGQYLVSVSTLQRLLRRFPDPAAPPPPEAAARAKPHTAPRRPAYEPKPYKPDCAHLVCFATPTPPLPPEPKPGLAWDERLAFVSRLHAIADVQPEAHVEAGLRHLADLHYHHTTFYRDLDIPPTEGLPVILPSLVPVPGLIGSQAQACAESV